MVKRHTRLLHQQWRTHVDDPGVMAIAVLGIIAAIALVVYLIQLSFVLGMLGLLLVLALLYYSFSIVG